jgi:predicted nucleic acid-binding protein
VSAYSLPPPRPLYVAEPPAVWSQREPVVADCSVIAALLLGEPAAAEAAALLEHKVLHAPSLLSYELANVARSKLRAGAPAAAVQAAIEGFAEQRVFLHEVDPQPMLELAMHHGLSAYDAAYLHVAATLNARLATFDRRLAEAAQKHLGR